MSDYKKIILKKGKEDSLLRRHPWIFSGAIHHTEGNINEGDVVRVLTSQGEFIAVGHWQIGSIAVRVLSFDDVTIDGEFYENKLAVALDVRRSIGLLRRKNYVESVVRAGLKALDCFRIRIICNIMIPLITS